MSEPTINEEVAVEKAAEMTEAQAASESVTASVGGLHRRK